MHKHIPALFLLVCFVLPSLLLAQSRTLTGIVTTKGTPLKNVAVYLPENPAVNDTTDEKGEYQLPVNGAVRHLAFKAAEKDKPYVVKFHHKNAKKYDFDTEQDVGYFTWQGNFACNYSNSFFSVYQSNGNNNNQSTLLANIGLTNNYHKNRFNWNTDLKILYGQSRTAVLIKQGVGHHETRNLLAKNNDLLSFTTKVGYEMKHKIFLTVLSSFQSQFTKSYADPYAEERGEELYTVSRFLSPANCNLGIGLDFKPNRYFSLYISPLDLDLLIVKDTSLHRAYDVFHESGVVPELGAFLNLDFKYTFFKKLNFNTKLQMFTNYIKDPKHPEAERPGSIDVQLWKNTLTYQFNKFISLSFTSLVRYDEDTEFRIHEGDTKPGEVTARRAPRTQYFHNFGVGLGYNFSKVK